MISRGRRILRRLGAPTAIVLAAASSVGCAGLGSGRDAAATAQTVTGLKEMLRVGTDRTIERTAREGGFRDDPRTRLRLPPALAPMFAALDSAGLTGQAGALELAMNRAAERAAGYARAPLEDAIAGLQIPEAAAVLQGPFDAATRLLRSQASPTLHRKLAPIVDDATRQVGLAQAYAQLLGHYRRLGVADDPPPSLTAIVTTETLSGLLAVLAQEERRIRTDPSARTTPRLRALFAPAAPHR